MSQQADLDVTDADLGRTGGECANRLGDRLQRRVLLTVFPDLAQGFLEDRNRLAGVEREPTDDELDDLFQATRAFLYRLLFLLYAESRDLLPVRDPRYFAVSLRKIQEEIAAEGDTFSDTETGLFDRLLRLFHALDQGDPVLNVPSYHGELFHNPRWDHKIPDRRLAVAIDSLSRDRDEHTRALAFIDYKSLDVRRLGSIYEALLDRKLRLADEHPQRAGRANGRRKPPLPAAGACKRQVQLANDNVKRKASGSYYTPPAIVEYLIANAVGPVLDAKLEALRRDFRKAAKTFDKELQKSEAHPSAEVRKGSMDHRQWAALQTENQYRNLVEFAEGGFDLRVIDPAMGCGHFLVEAVNFITGRLLEFLAEFPNNPVRFALDRIRQSLLQSLAAQGLTADRAALSDRHLLKRHVLRQCIYGVDLDPMAVELAKASLQLDACVPGAPFGFLDHHLRSGNALIGTTFEDLRQALGGSLHRVSFEPLLRALRHISSINKKFDVNAVEVQQSADEHTQARQDLSGYEVLFDVPVAKHFGFPEATDLLTKVWKAPTWDLSNRESFLQCLKADGARQMAEQAAQLGRRPDLRFFHWEIEFPDAYFTFVDHGQRQIRPKNDWVPGSAGFDCVVGNPPYVRIQNLDEAIVEYLGQKFESARRKFDLYIPFLERGTALLRQNGLLGMIVPNKFLSADYGAAFRGFAARNRLVRQLVDFEADRVFAGAGTYCCLVFLGIRASDTVTVSRGYLERPVARETAVLPSEGFCAAPWSLRPAAPSTHLGGTPLKSACRAIFQGLITGADRLLIGKRDGDSVLLGTDSVAFDPGIFRPVLKGPDVRRFALRFSNHYVLYPYRVVDGRTELIDEEELEARHPGAYRYLCEHRRELKNRGSASMAYPAWYAHWCPRTIDRFRAPKIVTQVLASRASFALDRDGDYTFVGGGNAGVYGVVPSVADEDRLWLLLAILNSRTFEGQVEARSSRFRGGYFSYARRFIENAAIPHIEALDLSSDLPRRIVNLAKQRAECEAESNNPLEAQLDLAVDELYQCGTR